MKSKYSTFKIIIEIFNNINKKDKIFDEKK